MVTRRLVASNFMLEDSGPPVLSPSSSSARHTRTGELARALCSPRAERFVAVGGQPNLLLQPPLPSFSALCLSLRPPCKVCSSSPPASMDDPSPRARSSPLPDRCMTIYTPILWWCPPRIPMTVGSKAADGSPHSRCSPPSSAWTSLLPGKSWRKFSSTLCWPGLPRSFWPWLGGLCSASLVFRCCGSIVSLADLSCAIFRFWSPSALDAYAPSCRQHILFLRLSSKAFIRKWRQCQIWHVGVQDSLTPAS